MSKSYTVCPKCGVNHSVLVRHRCFKPEPQKDPPKHDPNPGDEEEGDGDGKGQPDKGEGQPKDGEGEGDGQGEGEGDGEGDGEGEGEGPAPQPPEPEAPPVAIVCTVLKFAALTAECSDAYVTVQLAEEGLLIVARKADAVATATIPWGEFEQRSTLDGEYYVKETIDAVATEAIEKNYAGKDDPGA